MDSEVTRLYDLRFKKDLIVRNQIWKILCQDFFQKYIKKTDTVCDIGAGFGEFINNIQAKNKIAVDINPQIKKYAAKNVKSLVTKSTNLPKQLKGTIDVVFVSNFFEHLATKEDLVKTLLEIKRVLKRKGILIILMPNIRYVGASYWDFLDHQLPLTDKSMEEALSLNNFEIVEKKPRFLPYTTKSSIPKAPILVSIYLKLPLLHLLLGKQSLIIARKNTN